MRCNTLMMCVTFRLLWNYRVGLGPAHFNWLKWIQEYIATSLDFRITDFEYTPFAQRGGVAKALQLFGDDLDNMLTDLTHKLVS